jgi:hypothetical protein
MVAVDTVVIVADVFLCDKASSDERNHPTLVANLLYYLKNRLLLQNDSIDYPINNRTNFPKKLNPFL